MSEDAVTPDTENSDVSSLVDEDSPANEEVTETLVDEEPADDKEPADTEEKTEDDADQEEEADEYEDFEFPEGTEVNQEELTEFKGLAKELGLNQEGAQKLIDFEAKRMAAAVETAGKEQEDLMAETKARWLKEIKSDKEIGGKNLNENIGIAKKALDHFGTPELKEFLKNTGASGHKEIVRAFYRVGLTITEDTLDGGDPSPGKRDVLKDWYGD